MWERLFRIYRPGLLVTLTAACQAVNPVVKTDSDWYRAGAARVQAASRRADDKTPGAALK